MTKKPIKPVIGTRFPASGQTPPPPKGPQKRDPNAMTQSIDPRSPEARMGRAHG